MSFLFFIVPVLIVAGAFLWLKPSPRDQYLAKLRSNALVQGFRISSLKVPDLSEFGRVNDKKEIVTLYEKGLQLEKDSLPRFTVLRTTGESGVFLPDGWAWDIRTNLQDEHYRVIASTIAILPSSVSLLSLMGAAVAVSWDEKDQEVTFDLLNEILAKLAQQFGRITI